MTEISGITVEQIFRGLTQPRKRNASQEDRQVLQAATRHTVEHDGLELVAWSWGAGETILLLHGWESRSSHFAAFVQPLLSEGYRVIALDAPAHGDSQGQITDVMDFGRALVAAADHFGQLASVISHSMGSAASLYAFSQGVEVKTSVHLSGPASLTRLIHRTATQAGLDAQELAQLEAMMVDRLASPLSAMDLSSLSSGMKHPALILHDPEDREIPFSESKTLSQAWPESILEAVDGVGHRRILQAPSVVASAVSFIAQFSKGGVQ